MHDPEPRSSPIRRLWRKLCSPFRPGASAASSPGRRRKKQPPPTPSVREDHAAGPCDSFSNPQRPSLQSRDSSDESQRGGSYGISAFDQIAEASLHASSHTPSLSHSNDGSAFSSLLDSPPPPDLTSFRFPNPPVAALLDSSPEPVVRKAVSLRRNSFPLALSIPQAASARPRLPTIFSDSPSSYSITSLPENTSLRARSSGDAPVGDSALRRSSSDLGQVNWALRSRFSDSTTTTTEESFTSSQVDPHVVEVPSKPLETIIDSPSPTVGPSVWTRSTPGSEANHTSDSPTTREAVHHPAPLELNPFDYRSGNDSRPRSVHSSRTPCERGAGTSLSASNCRRDYELMEDALRYTVGD